MLLDKEKKQMHLPSRAENLFSQAEIKKKVGVQCYDFLPTPEMTCVGSEMAYYQ